MAVARLSRVTLGAPRKELGVLLARIIEFRDFHPTRPPGAVQDIGMLLLSNRAQSVYAQASDILGKGGIRPARTGAEEVERFAAHSVEELVATLEEYVDIIEKNLSLFTAEEDREGVRSVLLAIQEASSMVFNDLQRILVLPQRDDLVRFEGFVPTGSLKVLREKVGPYLVSAEPVRTQGKEAAYVPTLLVNPRMIAVFEGLTLQRGLPRYGEVDPTPILSFVFPFFFGMMFGDVGHGFVLLAFGLYLVHMTTYKSWGELILILSSSTVVFGLIRGVVFGVTFDSPLAHVVTLPPAFSASFTLSYIPFLLELAIVIGTFHLASGYAIAFINRERAGDYLDAFLSRLPTIVLYSSMLPLGFAVVGTSLDLSVLFTSNAATPVFNDLLGVSIPIGLTARVTLPIVAATLFFLVIGHPVKEYAFSRSLRASLRALGSGLVEALVKPFEFFTNTLSYVRLGVLLVTTTLLGSLVAGVMSYGVVGVLLAAGLNIAVIGLEGLIVYIQDMRLQLYEWFSQFYVGAGTPFTPLVSAGAHFSVRWDGPA